MANTKQRDRKNPDGSDTYWCPACRLYLPPDMFHYHHAKKYNLASICKQSIIARLEQQKKGVVKKRPLRKCKLDRVDRGSIDGFKKYYSQRTFLFKDIYGIEYSEGSAVDVFNELFSKH